MIFRKQIDRNERHVAMAALAGWRFVEQTARLSHGGRWTMWALYTPEGAYLGLHDTIEIAAAYAVRIMRGAK